MLAFVVEAFLPVPFSLGWMSVHGRGRDRKPLVPGGTCWWLRPLFKWTGAIFLLFQWDNMLSMVILTMPWVMVSPEEMRKDTVVVKPCIPFIPLVLISGRWEDGCRIRAKTEIRISPKDLFLHCEH